MQQKKKRNVQEQKKTEKNVRPDIGSCVSRSWWGHFNKTCLPVEVFFFVAELFFGFKIPMMILNEVIHCTFESVV
jgi:hypothetical protein